MDQEQFDHFVPLAYQWAKEQEAFILRHGATLSARQMADARLVGVQDPDRIRVLVVDRMPLPEEHPELAEAARYAQIITDASRGIAIGHGVIIRVDSWTNRELLLHQLVHVAQCERSGGLESFVREYLFDRQNARDFSVGSFEDEARGLAREICAADQAVQQPA